MRRQVSAFAVLLALPLLVSAQASAPARRQPPANPDEARERVLEASRGMASWYGLAFEGKPTASGEPYDPDALTAAHPTLPFGTVVEVHSLVNGRRVRVRINDRGPHVQGRMIDLSAAAARALGLQGKGIKLVEVRVVEQPEPVPRSKDVK